MTVAPEKVVQAHPDVVIEQWRPTVKIPVEILNEPTTVLGKVVVVLKQASPHAYKWNRKKIIQHLSNHGWRDIPSEDLDRAIDRLLQWDILVTRSRYLHFESKRVTITEVKMEVTVK